MVVEGATVTSFVTEVTTMLVIGLILSMFGIGLFCWLIFTLAVYALPFFVLCGRPHKTNWTNPLRGSRVPPASISLRLTTRATWYFPRSDIFERLHLRQHGNGAPARHPSRDGASHDTSAPASSRGYAD